MQTIDSISSIQDKYRKLRLYTLIMLVLLISSVAFVFIQKNVTFVLLTVAILYHLFVLRKKQKEYSNSVTETNLKNTLCPYLGTKDLHLHNGGTITLQTLQSAGLMPVRVTKGSPLLCFGIDGQKNDFSVSICDATIAQDFTLQKKGRKRVHFNSGVWVHMEQPNPLKNRWCLLDETSVPTPIRMDYFSKDKTMQPFSVGNDYIGERCVLYHPIDQDVHLSAALLHEIKRLIDYTPGYMAISVNGNSIDFFIRGRFLSRPVSLSQAPTKETLSFDSFPELPYLIRIAKAV